MIDRLGNSIASLGRPGGTERSLGPGRQARFEDLIRGAAQDASEGSSSPDQSIAGGGLTRALRVRGSDFGSQRFAGRTGAGAEGAAAQNPPPGTTAASDDPASLAGSSEAPAPAPSGAFVRSNDARAPHLVRFASVPESTRYPLGSYWQAPPEFGGEWWQVSPFTGPEPWRAVQMSVPASPALTETQPLPIGFAAAFGARPQVEDFRNRALFQTALAQWEQDLGHFQGTGLPDGFSQTDLETASAEFEAWGLGKPLIYEGRYGWRVRFPESQLPSFEMGAWGALTAPHLIIAQYQVRSIQQGLTPQQPHPMLPEQLRSA